MNAGVAKKLDPQYQDALDQYAAAMKLFGQQKFERAKPLFEKVCALPFRELADRAGQHLNTCQGRINAASPPTLPAEEYYHHAIVRMNTAQFEEAEALLTKAQRGGAKGAHISYALACLRAQTRDVEAALLHLKEAIKLDPSCRAQARQDSDFDALMDDPRFTEVLYPESRG
ncbi:MAG TPA: hypothetical protein VN709_10505 [Terriglobales bacterium]|nr:hypothetical protein [Terriglobales bacterium]